MPINNPDVKWGYQNNIVDWFGNPIEGTEYMTISKVGTGIYAFKDANNNTVGMGFNPDQQRYLSKVMERPDGNGAKDWATHWANQMYGTSNPTAGMANDWLSRVDTELRNKTYDGTIFGMHQGLLSNWENGTGQTNYDQNGQQVADGGLLNQDGSKFDPSSLKNLGFGANPNYQGNATIGTGNSDLLAQRLAKIRGGV